MMGAETLTSKDEAPLWTEANFMATVPDYLKNDPDVLNMAAQFRSENERYERAVRDVELKEKRLRRILERLLYRQRMQ